eukprot:3999414-Karenia_brevis.AAC.1
MSESSSAQGGDLQTLFAEAGVPPEKRSKVADSVEKMMERIVDRAIMNSDARWDARCEELMGRFMAKVDEKLAAVEKRSDDQFLQILRRLDLVEKENAKMKESMSSTASLAGGAPSHVTTNASAVEERNFKPSRLEIKGFVADWSKRTEQALTEAAVIEWLQR